MRQHWLLVMASVAFLLAAAAGNAHAQTYTVLYNFGSNGGGPNSPTDSGIIAQGRDGNLYSTAPDTWSGGLGTAFKITPAGVLTVLHSFNGTDGQGTQSGLTLDIDGNYYGTTVSGGLYSSGTIFKMTAKGDITTLYNNFGAWGTAPPIRAIDGNFYGRTVTGDSMGTVYRLTPSGEFRAITLCPGSSYGYGPPHGNGPLLQAANGYLYGTTFWGCKTDHGLIISNPISHGKPSVLYDFANGPGIHPVGPLIQGSDGNFYGATIQGGYGYGDIFTITPNGVLTELYEFSASDGELPAAGLVQATDGNLYGTTWAGGATGGGVLFRIAPDGTFTVLHNFDCTTGCQPMVTLLQHTNGKLYGDTASGGSVGGGTFFSFDLGLGPFVTFLPAAGEVGSTVQFLGQGFTGTTAVSFNGTAAPFKVISDTFLKAIVPGGAVTGFVTVTTPQGTLTSNKQFQVRTQGAEDSAADFTVTE